ncbi:MAG: phosphatidylserine decarboxylase [Kiritimatiellae bacterium]|nr:phosphatidylserine decarboxylase [Kiritimatiellia bacterium]
MFRNSKLIVGELRKHAPFTAFGTLSGLVIMLILLAVKASPGTSTRLFWFMHPTHVLLSALVTAAMFRLHGGRGIWRTLWIGYAGSVGITTLSDCVIPFLGEWILGMPNRGLHFGFVEKWWLVNPLALSGILLGVWRPHTQVFHSLHVLLSTWASLFHITMTMTSPPSFLTMAAIAVFLFLAVWIPCCTSDIVFPLLFTDSNRRTGSGIRREVTPFLIGTWFLFFILGGLAWWMGFPSNLVAGSAMAAALITSAYFLYFFRDPERTPPTDDDAVVAGADGTIAPVVKVTETQYLKARCARISIFLSLFDVHVNRAPMAGRSTFLGYFPGKRLFTFQAKSSEVNQHNKILIEGRLTRCLVTQIVGPVCRRVVYWPPHDRIVEIALGERIGMMKFGSRLDMYLPTSDVEITAKSGDRVRAGETIVARLRKREDHEGVHRNAD